MDYSFAHNNAIYVSAGALLLIMTALNPVSTSYAQLIGVEDNTIQIPVTVVAPINVGIQNAQICLSALSGGDQLCQQVVLNPEQATTNNITVDLTQTMAQPAQTDSNTNQQAPSNTSSGSDGNLIGDTLSGEEPLVGIEGNTVQIPVTVIAPITANIQNAQVCATVASSAGQTCSQLVVDPEQTTVNDVTLDLTQQVGDTTESPAQTSLEAAEFPVNGTSADQGVSGLDENTNATESLGVSGLAENTNATEQGSENNSQPDNSFPSGSDITESSEGSSSPYSTS